MTAGVRSRGLPPTTIAVALLTTFLVGVTSAYAGSITVAWDPSPDPSVIGYRVYVGTTPGSYFQSFDAGNATTFTYNGVDGRTYYFAVAAYAAGPVIGPRSGEVVAGGSSSDPAGYWSSLWTPRSTTSGLRGLSLDSPVTRVATSASCWEPELEECVTVRTIAQLSAPVTSLAATADGRLFLVEGNRRLRVITSAGLSGEALLIADRPSLRFNQVVVDPTFADTGFIWISETHTPANGARTLSVVRYRVAGNRAGERVEILSRMPLPQAGDAVFAIGSSGHIYVALPASADGFDPNWGKVLRFNADGTVPGDHQSGSPVLTTGYTFPHAIALEPSSDRVWLSGMESQPAASDVLTVPVDSGARAALTVVPHADHHDLVSVAIDGVLKRTAAAQDGDAMLLSLDVSWWGRPIAITAGPAAEIYLSLHTPTAASTTSIVQLVPTR